MEAATVTRLRPPPRPPLLRETPCECGELPMLVNDVYVCTCPACPCYGQEAWSAP